MTARFGFVYLMVDDMARSLTFYQHLGFKFSPKAFGEAHVVAELPGGVLIVWNLMDHARVYAPDYEANAHGRVGLAFQLDTPEEVEALFAELKQLGYRCDRTPWTAPWGDRYAIVYDPDGNAIELYSPDT